MVVRGFSSKIQCRRQNSGADQLGKDGGRLGPVHRRKCPGAIWHDPLAKVIALTSPAGSHARADRLRNAPFTSDEEAFVPWRKRVISRPGQTSSEAGMAGRSLASIEQRTGQVRPPSPSFVHALPRAHHGHRCMNSYCGSYRVRKTVGWHRGARISAMPAKCRLPWCLPPPEQCCCRSIRTQLASERWIIGSVDG